MAICQGVFMGNSGELNKVEARDASDNTGKTTTHSGENASRQAWDHMPATTSRTDATGEEPKTLDLSASKLYEPMQEGDLKRAVTDFADPMANASSDAEAGKIFTDFVKSELKGGTPPLTIYESMSEAMKGKENGYFVSASIPESLSIYREPPEPKLLFETRMFAEGESTRRADPDFEPDYDGFDKMAADFVKGIGDATTPATMQANLEQVLTKMKAAGAEPSEASGSIRDALEDAGLPLRIYIDRRGAVEFSERHRPRLIARVNLRDE